MPATSTVIIVPTTLNIRPTVVTPRVILVRPVYGVYFRFYSDEPWLLYGSTTSLWQAENTREMLELTWGVETFVR